MFDSGVVCNGTCGCDFAWWCLWCLIVVRGCGGASLGGGGGG